MRHGSALACARGAGRGGELSSARGRAAEGREEGERERKNKMENEKGKWKMKKKKGKRERRERERLAPALIAATTAGPVGHAQRSRARTRPQGKGSGVWRSDVWNIVRFRDLVQGFKSILELNDENFWKKCFNA